MSCSEEFGEDAVHRFDGAVRACLKEFGLKSGP